MDEERELRAEQATIDLDHELGALLQWFWENPDNETADFDQLVGIMAALMQTAVQLDSNQAEYFMPILFPAMEHVLKRMQKLDAGAFDPDWRKHFKAMMQGRKS